ncbi:Chromosome partition protein Smc [Nitrospira sp. KM1]|uniref:chromosome segregation protein SMC n=1 Tax=Nitrospira sp. KM1 TaxID=1936990 RepID=UPI0013A73049|nr:chromosome segregation protein SMC [Nitrospira sp. KM1]BCA55921.1 Chromosome partition protein Smc [Nitrospira sp. KM1]
MYLKSLEMLGFKSFAEARIEFPEGVTAIVGPNGSGKSNVVDAILWVLGEQSTKTLRSEKMEDVIFNGTELRKPLGMAEVSLIISGLDHIKVDPLSGLTSQLAEYQDLMITRRLYRNGDSEYLLNKAACRLKDIRSVLLDTRAGTKGHTVIAQGQIDQILNASPQDRRELIEETAGIVRYKKQKAEALRKLDSTHQNLLRVRDIIAEVKKQLNSLERQARQARSYQLLQQEARTLEIRLLTDEYRTLSRGITDIEKALSGLTEQESEQAAQQGRLTAELERTKLSIAQAGEVIQQRRQELERVEQQQSQALTAAEVERHRGELFRQQRVQGERESERMRQEQERVKADDAVLRETLETLESQLVEREQELEVLDCEVKALLHRRASVVQEEERGRVDVLNLAVLVANTEQNLSQLTTRVGDLSARETRMAQEREEFRAQHLATADRQHQVGLDRREAETSVVELRHRQQELAQSMEQTERAVTELDRTNLQQAEELAAADSHLRALQDVLREAMGYARTGAEESTALKGCDGVQEAIAEWLEVPSGLERAVEAILGERVRGWFVDNPEAATRAVGFLTQHELGRGAFLPQSLRWTERQSVEPWWELLRECPGVVGQALDLIRGDDARNAVRAYLFSGVVIVDTLDVAMTLWRAGTWTAPEGPTFVTRSGEVLDAAGVVSAGQAGASGAGLLERRREVMDLDARRTRLGEALEEGRCRREQMGVALQSLREESRVVADFLREAELKALSLQKDETGLHQFLGNLSQRIEVLEGDSKRDSEEVQRLEQEVRLNEGQLAQWMREKMGQEQSLGQVRARATEIDHRVQEVQQRLTAAQLSAQGVRTTCEHHRRDLERVRQEHEEAVRRSEELTQQLESLSGSIEQSEAERRKQEDLCRDLGAAVDAAKGLLVGAQDCQTEDLTRAQGIEVDLDTVRNTVSSLREQRMTVEVKRAEVRTQLGVVESTLTGTYEVDLGMLSDQFQTDALPDGQNQPDQPVDDPRQQLQKIRERLDRMGPINLAAISEHQELEERHRFLTTQEQDLSNSIASLKEIIQRINRTTKDMFASTFAELQEKFSQVFAKFFPGGRAELQLVDAAVDESGEGTGSEDPGVEIVAQPPGKRLKNITMLSGGEKTLTAMALLFASFLIRPTPFCILDEIDAPLDEENIGRFTAVLRELSSDAQFMVITHNKRTMGIADSLFGVTMEEPGISKLVSVRLSDFQPA